MWEFAIFVAVLCYIIGAYYDIKSCIGFVHTNRVWADKAGVYSIKKNLIFTIVLFVVIVVCAVALDPQFLLILAIIGLIRLLAANYNRTNNGTNSN